MLTLRPQPVRAPSFEVPWTAVARNEKPAQEHLLAVAHVNTPSAVLIPYRCDMSLLARFAKVSRAARLAHITHTNPVSSPRKDLDSQHQRRNEH
jgi:hypothetical protein